MKKKLLYFLFVLVLIGCSPGKKVDENGNQRSQEDIKKINELEIKYKNNPADPKVCSELGKLYFEDDIDLEKVKLCIKLFKVWLDHNPDSPEAKAYYASALGRFCGVTDDIGLMAKYGKRSWVLLDEAKLLHPNNFTVLYLSAVAGVETPKAFKKYKLAIKDFEKILLLKKEDKIKIPEKTLPSLYYFYFKALKIDKQDDKAKEIYTLLQKECPDHFFTNKAKEELND